MKPWDTGRGTTPANLRQLAIKVTLPYCPPLFGLNVSCIINTHYRTFPQQPWQSQRQSQHPASLRHITQALPLAIKLLINSSWLTRFPPNWRSIKASASSSFCALSSITTPYTLRLLPKDLYVKIVADYSLVTVARVLQEACWQPCLFQPRSPHKHVPHQYGYALTYRCVLSWYGLRLSVCRPWLWRYLAVQPLRSRYTRVCPCPPLYSIPGHFGYCLPNRMNRYGCYLAA